MNSFLEFLLKEKNITEQIYNELKAKKLADAELEKELITKRIFNENELLEIKAKFFHIPARFIETNAISNETLSLIPEDSVRIYKFIPIKKDGNTLEIGIVNPADLKTLDALKFIAQQKKVELKIFLISANNFEELLKKYRSLKKEVGRALEELSSEIQKTSDEEILEAGKIQEEAPVTKIVDVILKHAYDGNASDIHIEPLEERSRVRFRVDGILYTGLFFPKEIQEAVVTRIKILANLRIDEKRIPQDGRFKMTIAGKEIDFRVAIYPTQFGEKAQMRLLDPTAGIKNLTDLGIFGRNLELIQSSIRKPFGLILVTGPTGSGKSTTLYSILNILNKETVNILTLEDPVEYYLEGINQSQIKPEIGYTFAYGLRAMVRQDPDIIMVGEIRDQETAGLAVHSALTGHIVLSTLHTNNSVGIVPRLLEMGVEKYLLPTALNLAIAQRLIKRLCPHCKKPIKIEGKAKEIIEESLLKIDSEKKFKFSPNSVIYQPVGCPKCANKGTKGRIGIYEALEMTKEMEEIILHDPTENKLKEEGRRQKMITMKQDGIMKALQGIVSLEEILGIIKD